jgi:hypothetical protein
MSRGSAGFTSQGWLAGPGTALLLVLALVLAFVRAGQPLHLHHGESSGLYNAEHVLAALDSVTGDAPLPAPVRAAQFDETAAKAQLPIGVRPAVGIACHADPRAPPLT